MSPEVQNRGMSGPETDMCRAQTLKKVEPGVMRPLMGDTVYVRTLVPGVMHPVMGDTVYVRTLVPGVMRPVIGYTPCVGAG